MSDVVYRVRDWRSGGKHWAELVREPIGALMPRHITGVNPEHFLSKIADVEFRYDKEIVLEWA